MPDKLFHPSDVEYFEDPYAPEDTEDILGDLLEADLQGEMEEELDYLTEGEQEE